MAVRTGAHALRVSRPASRLRGVHPARRGLPFLLAAALALGPAPPAAAQPVLAGDEPNGPYSGLWSWPEIVAQLDRYQRDYPDLVRVVSIGTTYEGRDILAVGLSGAADNGEAKPELLFMAGIHPREQAPQIAVMRFMDELIAGYGADERITRLMDSRVLWIIPVLNVDGKVHDLQYGNGTTRGAGWRTNRRPFGGGRVGVDLNRNGLVGWGSASDVPGSLTYQGPGPLSEPETRALFDFMDGRDIRIFLDIHSTSRTYIIPNHMIKEEAARYRRLIQGMQARQREPYQAWIPSGETEARVLSATGVGQTHVTGFYVHGAYSFVLELGPAGFYARTEEIHRHYEQNVREAWLFLLEEAGRLPAREAGSASLAGIEVRGAVVPGGFAEVRPRINGEAAFAVLVSGDPAVRVTGDYRLLPARGTGHIIAVDPRARPGSDVVLELYVWDRERRRTVLPIPIRVQALDIQLPEGVPLAEPGPASAPGASAPRQR